MSLSIRYKGYMLSNMTESCIGTYLSESTANRLKLSRTTII